MEHTQILRPDSKGRITLGKKLVENISSYHITVREDRSIVLEPYVEIPASEMWIYENPKVLESIKRGVEQSKKGRTRKLGDFSQYIDEK